MKPNPRSRTSRLIVPLGIRVSLGARAQRESKINFRSSSTATDLGRFGAEHEAHQRLDSKGLLFLDVHGNHGARAGQRIVQVIAELKGELVLAWRQLRVELGLPVAEMDPGRSALHDGLAGRQTTLIDADMKV